MANKLSDTVKARLLQLSMWTALAAASIGGGIMKDQQQETRETQAPVAVKNEDRTSQYTGTLLNISQVNSVSELEIPEDVRPVESEQKTDESKSAITTANMLPQTEEELEGMVAEFNASYTSAGSADREDIERVFEQERQENERLAQESSGQENQEIAQNTSLADFSKEYASLVAQQDVALPDELNRESVDEENQDERSVEKALETLKELTGMDEQELVNSYHEIVRQANEYRNKIVQFLSKEGDTSLVSSEIKLPENLIASENINDVEMLNAYDALKEEYLYTEKALMQGIDEEMLKISENIDKNIRRMRMEREAAKNTGDMDKALEAFSFQTGVMDYINKTYPHIKELDIPYQNEIRNMAEKQAVTQQDVAISEEALKALWNQVKVKIPVEQALAKLKEFKGYVDGYNKCMDLAKKTGGEVIQFLSDINTQAREVLQAKREAAKNTGDIDKALEAFSFQTGVMDYINKTYPHIKGLDIPYQNEIRNMTEKQVVAMSAKNKIDRVALNKMWRKVRDEALSLSVQEVNPQKELNTSKNVNIDEVLNAYDVLQKKSGTEGNSLNESIAQLREEGNERIVQEKIQRFLREAVAKYNTENGTFLTVSQVTEDLKEEKKSGKTRFSLLGESLENTNSDKKKLGTGLLKWMNDKYSEKGKSVAAQETTTGDEDVLKDMLPQDAGNVAISYNANMLVKHALDRAIKKGAELKEGDLPICMELLARDENEDKREKNNLARTSVKDGGAEEITLDNLKEQLRNSRITQEELIKLENKVVNWIEENAGKIAKKRAENEREILQAKNTYTKVIVNGIISRKAHARKNVLFTTYTEPTDPQQKRWNEMSKNVLGFFDDILTDYLRKDPVYGMMGIKSDDLRAVWVEKDRGEAYRELGEKLEKKLSPAGREELKAEYKDTVMKLLKKVADNKRDAWLDELRGTNSPLYQVYEHSRAIKDNFDPNDPLCIQIVDRYLQGLDARRIARENAIMLINEGHIMTLNNQGDMSESEHIEKTDIYDVRGRYERKGVPLFHPKIVGALEENITQVATDAYIVSQIVSNVSGGYKKWIEEQQKKNSKAQVVAKQESLNESKVATNQR